MKTWMKVVLGIFAGIAVVVGVVFWITAGVAKAGDDFFAAVQNDDIDAAYALLSEDFRAGVSKEGLQAYLAANALDDVKETSWSSRSINNGVGSLAGTVTTQSGDAIPIKLRLIDSDAGWKIHAITKESAGFQGGSAAATVPPYEKQLQLFSDTVSVLAASFADRSMKKLVDSSSSALRKPGMLAKFDNNFASMFQYADSYLKISKLRPLIDNATVNEKGVLTLRGHYPITPSPVYFSQQYIYEGIDWKLLGIFLQVGSPP